MRDVSAPSVLCLTLLAACAGTREPEEGPSAAGNTRDAFERLTPIDEPADAPPAAPRAAEPSPIEHLRAEVAELMAREEHGAQAVRVQHLLVAFEGSGVPGVTRSRSEAEALAAELLLRIERGEDFDGLIRQHTDDSAPGIYPMTRSSRARMVPAFGDVGWRLEVGEVGVAGHDPQASPYGWHIVKRLE